MAQVIVNFILQNLGDLLIQEAVFLYGVKDKVLQLQTELRMMRSYLHDADRRQNDNERLRNWISEIREAAYDSDDVIESYALRGASRRNLTGVLSLIKRYALIINKFIEIHMVGSHVDNVIARISSLTRNLETYGIRPEEGEASNSIYEGIIGVQDDVRILESCLVDPNKCYRVVAICGMGGLGKTTLAKVYHSLDVKSNFESLAWAYISQHCQARDVQEGILFQLISPSLEQRQEIVNMRDEELARMLYQVQEEKSCLVVLDDIWSVDTWKKLSPAFPNGRSPSVVGSKIVLTTRITISSCSKIRPFRKLMIQSLEFGRNTVSGREVAKRIDLLIHLRLLSLRNTKIDELPPSIGNLKCLMTLDLLTGNSTVLIPNVIGNMHRMRHLYLPESCEPDQLSSKLVKLKLKGSGLLLDPMPKLEKLPNLRLLELQLDSFMGKKLFCSSNGFPRLKSLIYDLANLEEWKLDKGAMPSLSKLEIANCTKLEKVPDGLRFVTTLQDLEIRSMFAAFRTKLEKGGEDHSLSNMCQLWIY
ncbi:putative disease resistance protein [Glycine max]|nr:putative disease resistance protein [Glycine max]